jgi:hypothetical protein
MFALLTDLDLFKKTWKSKEYICLSLRFNNDKKRMKHSEK